MNRSNLELLAPLLELQGGAGRRSTGKHFPSAVTSVPGTSRALLNLFSPLTASRPHTCLLGQAAVSAALEAGLLKTSGLSCSMRPRPGLVGTDTGSGALVESGSGEGNCFCLIHLPSALKNTEVLGCRCNICNPGALRLTLGRT